MKLFELYCSRPAKDGKYRENFMVLVLSNNAYKATELVYSNFRDAEIWQLNHKGRYGSSSFVIIDETSKEPVMFNCGPE